MSNDTKLEAKPHFFNMTDCFYLTPAKAMSAAAKESKRKEREGDGNRSKKKRRREERQEVQAAGEEQARKALQEKARKEREANEQWDEICRRATSLRATRLQPEPSPQCPDSWPNTTPSHNARTLGSTPLQRRPMKKQTTRPMMMLLLLRTLLLRTLLLLNSGTAV